MAVPVLTVFYGSKILKWKQITTHLDKEGKPFNCFLWFKDTKMKANHNWGMTDDGGKFTVFYGSKILKWKQITTRIRLSKKAKDCFLWFKDTKMKANHNLLLFVVCSLMTVFYGSKILKWKQITTETEASLHLHLLFPMVQRY